MMLWLRPIAWLASHRNNQSRIEQMPTWDEKNTPLLWCTLACLVANVGTLAGQTTANGFTIHESKWKVESHCFNFLRLALIPNQITSVLSGFSCSYLEEQWLIPATRWSILERVASMSPSHPLLKLGIVDVEVMADIIRFSFMSSMYAIHLSSPRTDPCGMLQDNWTGPTESDEVQGSKGFSLMWKE